MNTNNNNNLRRLAKLFKSFETAPSPKQLKLILSELEYKRFCEALGLYEIIKSTTTEQEKKYVCWGELPSEADIYFFHNYGIQTI